VHWPKTPIQRLQAFKPRFCPWPECIDHRRSHPGYRFIHFGSYRSRLGSRIPRFRCHACRRTFSRQTFSTTYFLKRPELLLPIASGLQAGSAHRQIARSLGCAHSTVARLSSRLGRHCLLLLARALGQLRGRLRESIVFDHFETFEYSQDFPLGIGTPVGSDSWFVYGLDPVPHKRAGKLSPHQADRIKARPKRPSRGGYSGSTRRVIETLIPLARRGEPVEFIGDGHPAYIRAARSYIRKKKLKVHRFPNPLRGPKGSPRSAEAVSRDRAMFPVDLLHGLLRHSIAHHKRETIAFGRRLNALMERLFVMAVWRNFVKGRSERKPDPRTPAMSVGLTDEPWAWRRVLSRRLFPKRQKLPAMWREIYRKDWVSPFLKSNVRHRLVRAY
jgi:transposase-like protein